MQKRVYLVSRPNAYDPDEGDVIPGSGWEVAAIAESAPQALALALSHFGGELPPDAEITVVAVMTLGLEALN